jgi:hypothetical protein
VKEFSRGNISGYLHEPPSTPRFAVALTHGAGADCRSRLLIAAADTLAAAGAIVLRYDLAFRRVRPYGPPFPAGAERDRQSVADAAAILRDYASGPIIVGGHSYGGRQSSMLAAEQPDIAQGLLLLSYPLHPPKKPLELRTAHFPNLRVKSVFVHGTNDAFGTSEELRAATTDIPAETMIIEVTGASHDLRGGSFDWNAVVEALRKLSSSPNT